MLIRDFSAAIRDQSLPEDAYAFYKVEGTAMATDFAAVRNLFLSVLTSQHAELQTERMTAAGSPAGGGLIGTVANASVRLAFGGGGTGSGR